MGQAIGRIEILPDPLALAHHRVRPVGELFWFVDQAAAGEGLAQGRAR